MTEYYKSRNLAEPVIYVQQETRWLAYDAQGSPNESPGIIAPSMLERLEPITAAEAERVLQTRQQTTARIASAVSEAAIERREGLLPGSAYTWAGTVEASPGQLNEVVAEWAERTGWSPVTASDGQPAYRFGRTSMLGGTWIKLTTSPDKDATSIWLEAGARPAGNRLYVPRRIEYQRTAEHFADGVLHELAYQRATLPADDLQRWARTRERRRRTTRLMTTAFWLIPAIFVPVLAAIWLTHNDALIIGVMAWGGSFWFADYILRLRSIGMRMIPATVIWILTVLPIAIVFTALAATGSHP